MSKVGVVLSGGGAKGAFQVGVLQRLIEKGINPSIYFGTSVGSLNAVGMAYHGIDFLNDVWMNIKGRGDILTPAWWKLIFMSGLFSMKPLRKKIVSALSGNPKAEVVVCYVDLSDGKICYSSNHSVNKNVFAKFVEASAAIPGIMELPSNRYADGGVREQAPLREAIMNGCDEIHVILCNPITKNPTQTWNPKTPLMASLSLRALDIMEHEVFMNDIELCRDRNKIEGYKKIDLHVYAPDRLIIDTLEFDPKKISEAIQQGRGTVI